MKTTIWIYSLAIMGMLLMLTSSCNKKSEEAAITVATLTTTAVINITANTASSGGIITNDGGSAVTVRGVCWSTSQSPTTLDDHSGGGTGTGTFVCNLVSLNEDTLYYVRAYATNNKGTAYGNQVYFRTKWVLPSFTVTAIVVQFQGGGEGLQFFGKCTNDDVKMTKVLVTDPIQNLTITYNINGVYFVKNEAFGLQDANIAYFKELGIWRFTFVGNRTYNDTSFSVDATLSVTGK